jgi:hypothetical protein
VQITLIKQRYFISQGILHAKKAFKRIPGIPGELPYIPKILQNAIFVLLLFALSVLKKTLNRAGYYSFFSKQTTQKSSRPKPSILKDHGYISLEVFKLTTVLDKEVLWETALDFGYFPLLPMTCRRDS